MARVPSYDEEDVRREEKKKVLAAAEEAAFWMLSFYGATLGAPIPTNRIEQALQDGVVTQDEIVSAFREALERGVLT